MKNAPTLYAPVGRRAASTRWLGKLGALLFALALLAGVGFAFLEFRDGRGGAWAAVQAGRLSPPSPAAPDVGSAFSSSVAMPPREAPLEEQVLQLQAEVARQPANPRAWAALAAVAERTGQGAEATRARLRVVQLQPTVRESWLELAEHHFRARRWRESEMALRRAVAMPGTNTTHAYVWLCCSVTERENPGADADTVRRLAAEAFKKNPPIYVLLAREMTRLGHTDVSVPMLELAGIEGFADVREALAEAYDKAGRPNDAARARGTIMSQK